MQPMVRKFTVGVIFLSGMGTHGASAEQSSGASQANSADADELQTITVVAQKQNIDLQKAPVDHFALRSAQQRFRRCGKSGIRQPLRSRGVPWGGPADGQPGAWTTQQYFRPRMFVVNFHYNF